MTVEKAARLLKPMPSPFSEGDCCPLLADCLRESESAVPGSLFLFIPHIFFLVLLRDWDVLAIWFQLMLEEFAKSIMFYAEGVVQNRCDVILSEKHNIAKLFILLLTFNRLPINNP